MMLMMLMLMLTVAAAVVEVEGWNPPHNPLPGPCAPLLRNFARPADPKLLRAPILKQRIRSLSPRSPALIFLKDRLLVELNQNELKC